jgi:adenylate kinase family enzyme
MGSNTERAEKNVMNDQLLKSLKAARRVSVPLVAITTPDPAATIKGIVDLLRDEPNIGGPMLEWDVVEGIGWLTESGKTVKAALVGDNGDSTIGNPVGALQLAKKLPPKSMLFVHLAGRLIQDPMTIQAVWNLRDEFKTDARMLILLSIDGRWPAELAGDIVTLDEALPNSIQLAAIVGRVYADGGITEKTDGTMLEKIVEAVQGLPAFQAEQVLAMSLTKKGCDVPALWERKRQQIEQTPGLKVSREQTTFDDIGGVTVVKDFLSRVMAGQSRPNAVVFVDEIEKFLAGSSGSVSDSSGVSQDQLGQLLSYMQDHNAAGVIFVGPPGAAKSAVAKAAGNVAGIPTIQLDLGAMKGGIVGQSEQNLRAALKVVTSVSNGKSLWIATCNSISDLPPELRRRFTLGTFFFDLPDRQELTAIWKIWLKKYDLHKALMRIDARTNEQLDVDSVGWTGAEIRQCCDIAYRLGCTLKEAAAFVVPVSRSASEQLERLRKAAEGRFLSASRPGVYTREEPKKPANGRRLLAVEE